MATPCCGGDHKRLDVACGTVDWKADDPTECCRSCRKTALFSEEGAPFS